MPAPTPTGTANTVAMPIRMSVPTIAFAMPPPASPTGRGSWRKNPGPSPGRPWATRCQTSRAIGTQSTSAANTQAPSARSFHARRTRRERRGRGGPRNSGRAGDGTATSGGEVDEEPRDRVHDQREREEHERDLDERRLVELAGRLGELVRDHARHRGARREQRRGDAVAVADHHGDRHGLAERAPEREDARAEETGARRVERHAETLGAR